MTDELRTETVTNADKNSHTPHTHTKIYKSSDLCSVKEYVDHGFITWSC